MKLRPETGTKALLVLAAIGAAGTGQSWGAAPPTAAGTIQVNPNPTLPDKPGEDGGIAGVTACNYQHSDAAGENSFGATSLSLVWGNRYDTLNSCQEITSVEVAFGPVTPPGKPIQVFILSDPNQDGNPDDSNVLAVVPGITANENTDTFNSYDTPDVIVSGKYFIAVQIVHAAGDFPARIDLNSTSHLRSWFGSGYTDANDPFDSAPDANIFIMDDVAFPGNWLIRGVGNGNPCADPLKFCRTDTNGDSNTNVDDLLDVIASWGQTGNPGPRPAGDTDPAPNGNCTVNVNDLLAVINNWGACPPPPNDLAANATNLPPPPAGSSSFNVPYDNSTATTDGPGGDACQDVMVKDVWYNYVTECTGNLRLFTEDGPNFTGNTDTVIAVYQGVAGIGPLVACDDDSGPGFLSDLTFQVNSGEAYKIRVSSWNYGTNIPAGPGTLAVRCTNFNTDICADAQPIIVGQQVAGNVFDATSETNNLPSCAPNPDPGPGIWYRIEGNGTTYTASLCGSPGEIWNSIINVYCTNQLNPCNNLFCAGGADDNTCGPFGLNESVQFCAVAGKDYYVLVSYPVGNQPQPGEGNFVLQVTSGAACNAAPLQCGPTPPPNDEATGATPVVNGLNPVSNAVATTSPEPSACAQLTLDTWYVYTPTATGGVNFSLCPAETGNVHVAGGPSDTMLGVYSGSPGNLTELGCQDDSCTPPGGAGTFSNVIAQVTNGVPVYIRYAAWNNVALNAGYQLSVGPLPSVCGNGIIEPGEQCEAIPHCTNCQLDNLAAIPDGQTVLENEPCIVNGQCDVTNFGNDLQNCAVGCAFSPAIAVGTIYRGNTSTYNTNAADKRDSDHWLFTPPHAAGEFKQYKLVINANFAGAANFGTAAATVCGGGVAFVEGTAAWAANTNYEVPVFVAGLEGGVPHHVRIRPGAFTGLPCPGPWTYTFVVIGPLN